MPSRYSGDLERNGHPRSIRPVGKIAEAVRLGTKAIDGRRFIQMAALIAGSFVDFADVDPLVERICATVRK